MTECGRLGSVSLHQFDLRRVVDFDVTPLFFVEHHAVNADGLALKVFGWIIQARLGEFRPTAFGNDDAQVFGVPVIWLGVEEDLAGAGAALGSLDEQFQRDRIVDPVNGFGGGYAHRELLKVTAQSLGSSYALIFGRSSNFMKQSHGGCAARFAVDLAFVPVRVVGANGPSKQNQGITQSRLAVLFRSSSIWVLGLTSHTLAKVQ